LSISSSDVVAGEVLVSSRSNAASSSSGIFIIYLRIICDAELHTRFNFEVDLVVSFDGNEKQFFHLGGSIHVSDMF
jgi:hypothetical protein